VRARPARDFLCEVPPLPGDPVKRFLNAYYRLLRLALTFLMGLILVPVSMQILSRYTGLIPPYIWTEEVARFCFMWIVMLGAMIAVRDGTHFEVDILPKAKTARSFGIGKLVVHFFIFLVGAAFIIYGYDFAKFGYIQVSELTGINMLIIYIAWPLAGVTWIMFLVEKFIEDFQWILGKRSLEDVSG
jgi:TRAP-type C4-dicarboxylate transport system permease small subunit